MLQDQVKQYTSQHTPLRTPNAAWIVLTGGPRGSFQHARSAIIIKLHEHVADLVANALLLAAGRLLTGSSPGNARDATKLKIDGPK
jgi:hypothetical protein